ncbi:hypothetical protein SLEP1_g49754 [Rubroshorea leprosula]|uniref:Uncharacterized protein n=1 Tax=Rubroshorea leprosula TaxID=152421 RepID=A0AAV5LYS6_9ROSI|nr:hypothetical protein SLEP1_g49754 [Rubroshorea leprosula]
MPLSPKKTLALWLLIRMTIKTLEWLLKNSPQKLKRLKSWCKHKIKDIKLSSICLNNTILIPYLLSGEPLCRSLPCDESGASPGTKPGKKSFLSTRRFFIFSFGSK